MNNKDKQRLSSLEWRVKVMEGKFRSMLEVAQLESNPYCNQCNAYDPVLSGYICSETGCCQGLNPSDD